MDKNRPPGASKSRLLLLLSANFILGCALVVAGWYCTFKSQQFEQVRELLVGLCALLLSMAIAGCLSVRAAPASTLRSRILLAFWGTCAFSLGVAWGATRVPAPPSSDISNLVGRVVHLRGMILEINEGKGAPTEDDSKHVDLPNFNRVVVSCRSVENPTNLAESPVSGSVLINVRSCGRLAFNSGDTVLVKLKILPVGEPHGEWQWDSRSTLARRGIFCKSYATSEALVVNPSSQPSGPSISKCLDQTASCRRHQITALHKSFLGSKQGALLSSMVFGEHAVSLDEATKESFRAAGLAHVLAASGFNLTIVIAFACWLCGVLSKSRRFASLVGFCGVGFYVWMAGITASIMRAAVMCVLILFIRGSYRRPSIGVVMSLAALVACLIDPFCFADIGFQLSYVATISIVVGAGITTDSIVRCWPRCPRSLADMISGTIFAQVAVLPLQLWHFKETGAWFFPANLLVVPIVPLVSILGFVSSGLAMVGIAQSAQLVKLIDWCCQFPLTYMCAVVEFFAGLPYARVPLGAPSLVQLVCFYGALLLWLYSIKHSRLRTCSLVVLALSCFFLLWRPPLEQQVVVKLRGGTVTINPDRTAVCSGKLSDSAVRRILAFYGANIASSADVRFK